MSAKIQPKTIQGSLDTLQTLRQRNVRSSTQVLDHATFLIEASGVNMQKRLGDEYWAFLEQLAVAALDLGRDDIADDCIGQLNDRFPESPRVQVLQGMRWEAHGKLDEALKLYNMILEVDEANAAIWKRRVAVYKQMGEMQHAVEDLCAYADAFYTDVEAWLELADLYSARFEYAQALQALSHALAISPQNPFYVLQFAETAVTSGRVGLGLKMYLRVIEMVESEEGQGGGVARRAWFGVKLVTRRLLEDGKGGTGDGEDAVADEQRLRLLETTATEALGAMTRGSGVGKGAGGVLLKWLA